MAKIPINISLVSTSISKNTASTINLNLSNVQGAKTYFNLFDIQSKSNAGVSVASNAEWSNAWKTSQRNYERSKSHKEDHTHPAPLIVDIISSLPLESPRRRSYENIKLTFDGTASNLGNGLDTITRELHRDLTRISKQSDLVYYGTRQSLPSYDQLLGSEEGQSVSNLQDWRPFFANGLRRVSDAFGSHSDTDHSIIKDSCGPAAFLPSACVNLIDNTTSFIGDQIEGAFKFTQTELMKHLPSKVSGGLRQLSTALDDVLSVPFDIASDIYNGLKRLMTEVSDLLDSIKTKIFKWFTSIFGGLTDGLFPEGLLNSLIDFISMIADEFGDLFDLFGGFSVISGIKDVFSNLCAGNLLGAFRSATNLSLVLASGLNSAMAIGKNLNSQQDDCLQNQLNLSKLNSLARKLMKAAAYGTAIEGVLNVLENLGNIGTAIKNTVVGIFKTGIAIVRNLGGIIAGLLPSAVGYVLNKLIGKLCNLGTVGNQGFSIGASFDNRRDRSFEFSMRSHASHASIVAPFFNKKANKKGSYADEPSLGLFENSLYIFGAQGTKGVTMVSPGGSIAFKSFARV